MAKLTAQRAIFSRCVAAIWLLTASAADAAVCTEQYAPVCGQAGRVTKTYSNRCFARADGAKVIAQGSCRSGDGPTTPK
jgi:Kazal-type serine protease inhibitor domain